jgi:hypothetical protein
MSKNRQSAIQRPAVRPLESLIHVLRGHRVMLDADLAVLYGVSIGALNQAVRRNVGRFPEDFMLTLTRAEVKNLKSQTVTSRWGGRRTPPVAFTEHGVSMLSAVLRSERAVQMSISIIPAFVRMRELISSHKDLAVRVERLEKSHERTGSVIEVLVENIDRLGRKIEQIKAPSPYSRRRIGYITEDD